MNTITQGFLIAEELNMYECSREKILVCYLYQIQSSMDMRGGGILWQLVVNPETVASKINNNL